MKLSYCVELGLTFILVLVQLLALNLYLHLDPAALWYQVPINHVSVEDTSNDRTTLSVLIPSGYMHHACLCPSSSLPLQNVQRQLTVNLKLLFRSRAVIYLVTK